ncbi:MAG: YdeI/OmpD-associated family protein [Acidobacteriota bacterium]|nr:YdeI/OmpD-associated family protein [Acidobacteriota bacterium]
MKEIKYFAAISEFREWLEANHVSGRELQVGFYKKNSGEFNFSWSDAVDAAICYGWIDGVRHKVDELSYTVRFTPRKSSSVWSAVNIKKVAELSRLGLMRPAGIAAFEKRSEAKSSIYAYEQKNAALGDVYEAKFRANARAWEFFEKQAAYYRRTAIWQVISAKQEETRLKRLDKLIAKSEAGEKV